MSAGTAMGVVAAIARAEIVLMARSRLAVIGMAALLLLSVIAAATSTVHMAREQEQRHAHQHTTDELFRAQPDRHPHRMVHYGTYAYRPVSALAAFDPGVDPFTGTVLYLEGHRQNSATFGAVREETGLMRFGRLTPAFVLQVLAPLLLVFLGFALVARERESGTLRQLRLHGAGAGRILAGKGLALALVAGIALLPALAALALLVLRSPGELGAAALVAGAYTLYLLAWVALITAVSALARSGRGALITLVAAWAFIAVLAPRGAAELAGHLVPLPTRAETDLLIQAELRRIGDSHNADDPFFNSFRERLLAEHGVQRIEDLPFNYRGALSLEGEALTSRLFDTHAQRMADIQRGQRAVVTAAAVLSPAIAVRRISMAGAGTDLEQHLRFLQQGEAHRFALVQQLNRIHRDQLTFADDSVRSRDPAAERRTRVAAANWATIPDFQFQPADPAERRAVALPALAILAVWLGAALLLAGVAARRLDRGDA